jgi:hypothetical protein
MKLKDDTATGKINKRPKRKKESQKLQFGDNYIQQLPKESEEAFLARADRKNRDRINEAKFAAKFNVDVVRDESTGTIKLRKKPKHEIDELLKRKQMSKRDLKREKRIEQKKQEKKERLDKKQHLENKKSEQKRKEEDRLLSEYQFDKVEFGEVVHGPPSLNTKPRKAQKSDGAPRPGRKQLLLHSVIKPEGETEVEPAEAPKKPKLDGKSVVINKKGKRKNLPANTRIHLEKEQKNMIELYRQMKKQKASNKRAQE